MWYRFKLGALDDSTHHLAIWDLVSGCGANNVLEVFKHFDDNLAFKSTLNICAL